MLQRRTLSGLHHDERPAFMLINIVDRADVGMIQRRSCPRFTVESFECLPVFGGIFRQEFQGDAAAQPCILAAIHHAHAATAELLKYAVVGKRLADHREWGPLRTRMLSSDRKQVNVLSARWDAPRLGRYPSSGNAPIQCYPRF